MGPSSPKAPSVSPASSYQCLVDLMVTRQSDSHRSSSFPSAAASPSCSSSLPAPHIQDSHGSLGDTVRSCRVLLLQAEKVRTKEALALDFYPGYALHVPTPGLVSLESSSTFLLHGNARCWFFPGTRLLQNYPLRSHF